MPASPAGRSTRAEMRHRRVQFGQPRLRQVRLLFLLSEKRGVRFVEVHFSIAYVAASPPGCSTVMSQGAYHGFMQLAYAELHELVDRLTPEQANAVREVVRQLLRPVAERRSETEGAAEPTGTRQQRRLSFAGTLRSGRGDLAARSEEIIRSELGHSA